MKCDNETLQKLLGLAKIGLDAEEACEAVRSMDLFLRTLKQHDVGDRPLYYVWEDKPYYPPNNPLVHEQISVESLGVNTDKEGRIVYPWKGPMGDRRE